jgi:hypothetical protein
VVPRALWGFEAGGGRCGAVMVRCGCDRNHAHEDVCGHLA